MLSSTRCVRRNIIPYEIQVPNLNWKALPLLDLSKCPCLDNFPMFKLPYSNIIQITVCVWYDRKVTPSYLESEGSHGRFSIRYALETVVGYTCCGRHGPSLQPTLSHEHGRHVPTSRCKLKCECQASYVVDYLCYVV